MRTHALEPLPRAEGPGIAPRLRTVRHDDAMLHSHARQMAAQQRHSAYEVRLLRGQRRWAMTAARSDGT